jgi:SET domain-containing protein
LDKSKAKQEAYKNGNRIYKEAPRINQWNEQQLRQGNNKRLTNTNKLYRRGDEVSIIK